MPLDPIGRKEFTKDRGMLHSRMLKNQKLHLDTLTSVPPRWAPTSVIWCQRSRRLLLLSRRALPMPIGRLLVSESYLEGSRLFVRFRGNLQRGWHSVVAEPARH